MSGTISLALSEIGVREDDGQAIVPILREGDASLPVTVDYEITGDDATEGADFEGGLGAVTIPAGSGRVEVAVPILDDAEGEPTESLVLSLVNVSSGVLSAPRTARVEILDDEDPVADPIDPPLESPYEVTQEVVIGGLAQPIDFEVASDGRVYVAEKAGRVSAFDAHGAPLGEVLDIAGATNDNQDRGLLDIALHPDEPFLYAFHVVDPPEAAGLGGGAARDAAGNRYSHVVRFELAPDGLSVVPGSETVILGGAGRGYDDVSGGGFADYTSPATVDETASDRFFDPADPDLVIEGGFEQDYLKVDSRSHAGGALAFGPEGALYVSTGDGTSFNFEDPRTVDVQSLDGLSGKVLRIDPMTGEGLPGNPFVEPGDDLDLNSAKVWQLGLRNPVSMGFDEAGRLFVTDTGWNTFEEVNRAGPGANFGWPFYEGGDRGALERTSGYEDLPEAEAFYEDAEVEAPYRGFAHAGGAPGFQVQAITGGSAFLSDEGYPADLRGDYVFTDVSDAEVFVVDAQDPRRVEFLYQASGPLAPVHFGEGPDGLAWYVDLAGGEVGRLRIEGKEQEGERFVFRLIEAESGAVLDADLSDGVDALDPGQLEGELTVDVLARAGPPLESPVEMRLTGPDGLDVVRVEFLAPYAIFSNLAPDMDYLGRTLGEGAYEITATAGGVTETVAFDLEAPQGEGAPQHGPGAAFAEAGRAEVGSADRDDWTRVSFAQAMDDPVVVAGPPTEVGGGEPVVVRVRDVTSEGFEMRVDEWAHADGRHLPEAVGWMAVERGEHVLDDGSVMVAGASQASGDAGAVPFGTGLTAPVVLSQVASADDPAPVTARVSAVEADGFRVELVEEQAADGVHGPEALHWIAVEAGADPAGLRAGLTREAVTDEPFRLQFGEEIEDVILLAGMQTRGGEDTAALRLADLDDRGASIFVEEERSLDDEVDHGAEQVGWLAADPGFVLA